MLPHVEVKEWSGADMRSANVSSSLPNFLLSYSHLMSPRLPELATLEVSASARS
jgi:hypothetical protein